MLNNEQLDGLAALIKAVLARADQSTPQLRLDIQLCPQAPHGMVLVFITPKRDYETRKQVMVWYGQPGVYFHFGRVWPDGRVESDYMKAEVGGLADTAADWAGRILTELVGIKPGS